MEEQKVLFKKKTKPNLRKRNHEDENQEDDLGVDLNKLNELKELRDFKRSQLRGLTAEELLNLKVETTGKLTKSSNTTDTSGSNVDLVNTFAGETGRRDEDADMLKYIEAELAKRKGKTETNESDKIKLRANIDEIVFDEMPQHLLNTNKSKNEEMLSNQMLSGIPEHDLGYNEKIRNIEATEDAKRKAQLELLNKKLVKETSFVPNNMAVNYVQHNKFNINSADNQHHQQQQNKKPKIEPVKLVKEPVVVIGDNPVESLFKVKTDGHERQLKHPGKEKASDDYHYERFKKQFRK